MIKQEIISEVVQQTGLSEFDVKQVVDSTFQTITHALQNHEEIVIRGFGAFKIAIRHPRTGRNMKTGEKIYIGAREVVTFEPGKDLKNI